MEQEPKRGPGRPAGKSYPVRLTVRLTERHIAMLDERATHDRRAVAEMARLLIEQGLEQPA